MTNAGADREGPPMAGAGEPRRRAGAEIHAIRERLDRAQRELERAAGQDRANREREALLRDELLHRVRNILAVIRSIFTRTVMSSDSLEHVSDHFSGRLDALARYQAARA